MTDPDPKPAAAPPAPRLRPWIRAYARPLVILAAHLAVFTIARVALWIRYPRDFSALSGGTVVSAFAHGLRFDVSILSIAIGLPLLLLMLPFARTRTRLWQNLWSWVAFAMLAALTFVLAGDVIYFGTVHRHVGPEVAAVDDAFKEMSRAFSFYLLPLLAFVAVFAGLGWAWRRFLKLDPPALVHLGAQSAIAVVALVLLYYGERGTLTGKRMRIVHAFQTLPEAAAHLSLNGPYSLLRSATHARVVKADFYPWPEALKTAQEAVFAPGDGPADGEYPLLRGRDPRDAGKPNVVVIMLESWDGFTTDAHRKELGLPPLGFTPCYDAISREGILFPRFYANGQRSMDGLTAMLCGFPTLPGTSYLGRGLEQSSLTGMGHLARREGYETWFLMSSERNAFRIDAIAGLTGFDHYVGAEDIAPSPPAAPRTVLRGACWDHEMFADANRRLAAARRPFLAFLYTNTTHLPFFWPDDRWKKRTGDGLEDRYLNSLGYGDWSLGQFFEGAKRDGWYDRTVFLITADHLGGPGLGATNEEPWTKHHIPCLVIAPGLTPGVDRRIGSQLDVIPTISALAGWTSPHASFGSSLFADPAPGRGALFVEANLVFRYEEGGFVIHDLQGRIGGKGPDVAAVERRMLSLVQSAYTLLHTNRIARPATK